MNSSPKERYTVGLLPDTLDVSHTCRTAVSSHREIDVIKPPAPSSKRPPPRPASYMDPFVHHRGHGATFVSDVSYRSKHLFSQPHNRVTPTGEPTVKNRHLTTGKKILIGLVILSMIAVVIALVLYFVLSQDGNEGKTSYQQVTEVVSVSYQGIVSITADPPCTPGETLDPSSAQFQAQEELFCNQILVEVQSQNLTKDFDGCSVTENICEIDTSVRRRPKRQNSPKNLLKYEHVWRERVTYNKQDGFDKGRFTPTTKNACIDVVSNVIKDSLNMEQVQAPETQEIILQPVIGVSMSTETEETPTPSLRPSVSLSSMTALTSSANTPGSSSSRTDETSGMVVEGSTTAINVESLRGTTSIVEVYSRQIRMTMPFDVSTETLTSDAVSISVSPDISPGATDTAINILATNTEGHSGFTEPPIVPTRVAESPTESSTTDEAFTTTMKTTIKAMKTSAAVTLSEAPTVTEATTTLSTELPSTTLETSATTVLAITTTEGPATATQIPVTTVSTTKTAEAKIITSTETSTPPTDATMPSTETTSMAAKAINILQATTSIKTPVTTDAATATQEITTSTTEVLFTTQITISTAVSTATNEVTAATAADTTMVDITATTETATTEENHTDIPLTPSWSTCPGGLTGPNCEWTCGQPQVSASVACPRVIGGCEVRSNSWPFAAAYVTSAWEDNWDNYDMYYYLRCGAVVLSEHCAITAAHCQPLIGSAIVMGFHHTKDHPCPGAREENQHCQHRVITSRVFHENYTGGAYHDYDVVIVCWDEAVEFNEAIQPICLVSNNWDDQVEVHKDLSQAYGIGWGKTELDDYADGLKHVALPLYSYAQCVERYGDPITQRMLCAGGTTEDTCQRDSGGPLVYKLDRALYLIGLTSWGFECGNPDNPGRSQNSYSYQLTGNDFPSVVMSMSAAWLVGLKQHSTQCIHDNRFAQVRETLNPPLETIVSFIG